MVKYNDEYYFPLFNSIFSNKNIEAKDLGQFEIKGIIENPEVKLNTMSFAPGILRDLFSEDWLENENFFIKRAIE